MKFLHRTLLTITLMIHSGVMGSGTHYPISKETNRHDIEQNHNLSADTDIDRLSRKLVPLMSQKAQLNNQIQDIQQQINMGTGTNYTGSEGTHLDDDKQIHNLSADTDIDSLSRKLVSLMSQKAQLNNQINDIQQQINNISERQPTQKLKRHYRPYPIISGIGLLTAGTAWILTSQKDSDTHTKTIETKEPETNTICGTAEEQHDNTEEKIEDLKSQASKSCTLNIYVEKCIAPFLYAYHLSMNTFSSLYNKIHNKSQQN